MLILTNKTFQLQTVKLMTPQLRQSVMSGVGRLSNPCKPTQSIDPNIPDWHVKNNLYVPNTNPILEECSKSTDLYVPTPDFSRKERLRTT